VQAALPAKGLDSNFSAEKNHRVVNYSTNGKVPPRALADRPPPSAFVTPLDPRGIYRLAALSVLEKNLPNALAGVRQDGKWRDIGFLSLSRATV